MLNVSTVTMKTGCFLLGCSCEGRSGVTCGWGWWMWTWCLLLNERLCARGCCLNLILPFSIATEEEMFWLASCLCWREWMTRSHVHSLSSMYLTNVQHNNVLWVSCELCGKKQTVAILTKISLKSQPPFGSTEPNVPLQCQQSIKLLNTTPRPRVYFPEVLLTRANRASQNNQKP